MAVRRWRGTIDASWGTAGNWAESAVPVTDDEVVFDQALASGANSPISGMNQSAVVLKRLAVGKNYDGLIGNSSNPLIIGATNVLIDAELSGDLYLYSLATPDLTVNKDGSGDHSTIAAAIAAASAGNVIYVYPAGWAATDVYSENITINKNITLRGIHNPKIDGAATNTTVSFSGTTGATCILRGFTVQNGSAANGGGITLPSGAGATIQRCTITANTASSLGSGLHKAGSGNLTITDCVFSSNSGAAGGGGIRFQVATGTITITRCKFDGNASTTSRGGGIDILGTLATITNCTFTNNTANTNGGGLYIDDAGASNATALINCTIMDNTATTGNGGAIFADRNWDGDLKNCISWDNTAAGTAEIYLSNANTNPTITNCDIEGGLAGIGGAGTETDGGGNINSDPLVLGTGNDPYDLDDDSPCVNAGTATGAPTNDLLYRTRSTVDIGAYEQGATASAEYADAGQFQNLWIRNVKTGSLATIQAETDNAYFQRGKVTLTQYTGIGTVLNISYAENPDQDLTLTVPDGVWVPSSIEVLGGVIDCDATINTLTMTDGRWTQDTRNVTTLRLKGGRFEWNGGNITLAEIFNATLDGSKSQAARTGSVIELFNGAVCILDDGAGSISSPAIHVLGDYNSLSVAQNKTLALSRILG